MKAEETFLFDRVIRPWTMLSSPRVFWPGREPPSAKHCFSCLLKAMYVKGNKLDAGSWPVEMAPLFTQVSFEVTFIGVNSTKWAAHLRSLADGISTKVQLQCEARGSSIRCGRYWMKGGFHHGYGFLSCLKSNAVAAAMMRSLLNVGERLSRTPFKTARAMKPTWFFLSVTSE